MKDCHCQLLWISPINYCFESETERKWEEREQKGPLGAALLHEGRGNGTNYYFMCPLVPWPMRFFIFLYLE